MNEEIKTKRALFRFGVIAPLVCGGIEAAEQKVERRAILARNFEWPDGKTRQIGSRTLCEWVSRYRRKGFAGLYDITRSDAGSCRAIPANVLKRAEELRRELPARSVSTIISILKKEGLDSDALAGSTLNRQLKQKGATKEKLSQGAGDYQRFQKERANAMWQADTAHGIWLPDPSDERKVKRTKLILFVDDASRLVAHGQFYWCEQLPSLVDCFRKALMKRGKPCKLLFDNAFIFHSTTIEQMCAELGIRVSFCAPYAPSTKGKCERLIASIKSRFYPEAQRAGFTSIDQLNAFFFAWLSKEYHRHPHCGLEKSTPLTRWRKDLEHVERVSSEQIKRALMLRATRRVHVRTSTISLESRSYRTDPRFSGQTVELRWHAFDVRELEVWLNGACVGRAFQSTPGANIDFSRKHENRRDERQVLPLQSSKNFARKLMDSHRGETEISFPNDEYMSRQESVDLFQKQLGRELCAEELSLLHAFIHRYAPFRKSDVETLLEAAVTAKGGDRHIRYYLEQLTLRKGGRI